MAPDEKRDPSKDPGFEMVDPPERGGAAPPRPESVLPPITFGTFVLSISTSALVHMGVAPHPEGGGSAPEANLPLAQQAIEILEMLSEKTRGNLDDDERQLLESVLHDLRMRFVAARQKKD